VHGTDQLRLRIHKAVIAIRKSRPLRTKISAARITHRFPPLTDCKIFVPVNADEKKRLRHQVIEQIAALLRLTLLGVASHYTNFETLSIDIV
jgi:hypothetical protein